MDVCQTFHIVWLLGPAWAWRMAGCLIVRVFKMKSVWTQTAIGFEEVNRGSFLGASFVDHNGLFVSGFR